MSQLHVLDLQQNKLQDVPQEISQLSQLLVLNLNSNRLSKWPAGKLCGAQETWAAVPYHIAMLFLLSNARRPP